MTAVPAAVAVGLHFAIKNQTGYSGVSAVHGTSRYKAYYGKRMSTDGKLLPNHLGCFATAARTFALVTLA